MKIVIALSGGLDSAVLLADAIRQDHEIVKAVSFNYGSKHGSYEINCSHKIASMYGIPWTSIDLTRAFAGIKSSLLKTGPDIPEGHYEEESMRQTIVPFRNGIFLSVLAGIAESLKADAIAIGAHAGDHFIYPDCRPQFLYVMASVINEGTDGRVSMVCPFMKKTKKDIVILGTKFGVRFDLTRTCYKDQPIACGVCGSCQERLEAFHSLGLSDPLEYQSRKLLPKETQNDLPSNHA